MFQDTTQGVQSNLVTLHNIFQLYSIFDFSFDKVHLTHYEYAETIKHFCILTIYGRAGYIMNN